jgi:peptide/nickel transport system permease protein
LKKFFEYFYRNRSVAFGGAILGLLILVALCAPLIAEDPFDIGARPFTPPNPEFLMGTDYLGRDIVAMMAWGTRVALLFAFGAAGISLVVGVVLGAISGYVGGILDDIFSRTFELFIVIPRLFLIILLVAMFGAKLWLSVVIIGATLWPSNARIIRAQVLSLKTRGYVQAAIVSGTSDSQVLFRHIVPNGIAPVLANSTLQMAHAVLIEAGLSFLGLGDPNVASWGQILHSGQNYMNSAPWMVIFPGIAIIVLLMSLHMIGSGLLEVLNPRLQSMGV